MSLNVLKVDTITKIWNHRVGKNWVIDVLK